ncbi:MAG TPA: adenylate/guanylate cyclase domain-containing protein [Candidatus Rifleibacterium sp.]|nr:adenylate/guanylate cyclase domain-containing protein [Candidatus Rifleibacterium sp.]
MSEPTTLLIKKKVVIAGSRVWLAWVLLVLIPVIASIWCLDYFLVEYSIFAEPEKLAEAFTELESYKNAQVIENYLSSKLGKLSALKPQPADDQNPDLLKAQIDGHLGGKSIICLFFDAKRQKISNNIFRPADLKSVVFPPAALLKKQLPLLLEQQQAQTSRAQLNALWADQQRNALSIQQLFNTITPVTLKADRVVKNFSAQFGGELYFIYCEFAAASPRISGFLAVFRGKDFSLTAQKQVLRAMFPFCRTILREMDIKKCEQNPAEFFSGIRRLPDRMVITAPTDQRFIRHVVHQGGIELTSLQKLMIPFNEYHLPLSKMQHQFAGMKKGISLAAALLLAVTGLYCLRIVLFGVNRDTSFKRRILATTVLAALFPFCFFSATFYLHQQYDSFLQKINLLQHINTRLATFNSQLDHYLAWIEGTLSIHAQQINMAIFNDDAAIMKIFENMGSLLPVTRLALQRPGNSIAREYAERSSSNEKNDSSDILHVFFPERTLELLQAKPPLARTRQDELNLPGATIKISLIGHSLTSNGALFSLEHSGLPMWISNFRIVDEKAPGKPVRGLMFSRFEPAPLIKSFLKNISLASSDFQEVFGDYRIRYAFFPVERTGMSFIWGGSGHTSLAVMRQAGEKTWSETVTLHRADNEDEFLINRLNQGIPHNAVAYATPARGVAMFSNSLIAISGSLFYLGLVLFLANKLLDLFFVRPVMDMAFSAEQIARGRDNWLLELHTGDELEHLNRSFAGLVKGLQQRNMLKDYVSSDAFSDISSSAGPSLSPGGEYCEATILFAAIKDYHRLAAASSPQQTVELLNRFISMGDRIVKEQGGSLDKIINHTLMLVFREIPDEAESHALRAARTALRLAEVAQSELTTGIYAGIASGTVISGKIGSYKGKLDFTVIGNPVNLAARLKTEAATSNSGLIVSGSTMRLLKGRGKVNFLRRCSLKGKAREYNIYELYDLRGS